MGGVKASKLLKQARARAGLSQRALAARARISQPMISAIERGLQDPRHGTLERLLRSCGQELDLVLRGGEGVDKTLFPSLLRLSPRQRLQRAAEGARFLQVLDRARKVR